MKNTEINGCTVLEADAGKKIVKDNEFVCGTVVWLAVGDATDAYKEVSVEEADAMEKAQRETEGVKPNEEPPVETPTDIDMAKAAKIAEIAAYSDSDAVNSLTFNGIKTWLTRTAVSYTHLTLPTILLV